MSFFEYFRQSKKLRLLSQAEQRIDKELDLQKFLDGRRLFKNATMGLLTSRQRLFVQKMSHSVIKEDHSDPPEQSSVDEDKRKTAQKFLLQNVRRMVRSRDKTDQRFINIYRTRQALVSGVSIGFKGFKEKDSEDERSEEKMNKQASAINDNQSASSAVNSKSSDMPS